MAKKKEKEDEATETVDVTPAEVVESVKEVVVDDSLVVNTTQPVEVVELPKIVKSDKAVVKTGTTVVRGHTTFAFD